jgi:hypothetical protein
MPFRESGPASEMTPHMLILAGGEVKAASANPLRRMPVRV